MPDPLAFPPDWDFFLFFALGLVAGRIGAVLTEFFSHIEANQNAEANQNVETNFVSFFFKCQNDWSWFPFSWVAKKIQRENPPFRPFAIELLMVVLFVMLWHFIGWKYILLEYLLFTFALVVASAVDLEHKILPDSLTLSGILIGLAGALLNPEAGREFWPALGGVLIGGGFLWFIAIFYYALRKEEGLGGGDIKLLAWIGAVLTWKAVPFVILLSCFMGLFAGVFLMFQSKKPLEPEETAKDDSKDDFKAGFKDDSKDDSKDDFKAGSKNGFKDDFKAGSKNDSKDGFKDDSKDDFKNDFKKDKTQGGLEESKELLTQDKELFRQEIPFGPYLSLSALIYIFLGQELADSYWSFFIGIR